MSPLMTGEGCGDGESVFLLLLLLLSEGILYALLGRVFSTAHQQEG